MTGIEQQLIQLVSPGSVKTLAAKTSQTKTLLITDSGQGCPVTGFSAGL